MSQDIFVSVLIPAKNEASNLKSLLEEIRIALADEAYEIIVVDDGSTDASLQELRQTRHSGLSTLRILRHERSLGQSTSLYHAALAARGQWLATLDGDGQNDPADIPKLIAARDAPEGRGVQLFMGNRKASRKDTAFRKLQSNVANGVRSSLLGDGTPDTGCGIKLFSRDVFMDLPRFDHMHRFLPALFQRHGARVISVPVSHRPRMRGTSKYGMLNRLWVGIVDIGGVMWLRRRYKSGLLVRED